MSERKQYDKRLKMVGNLIREKRKSLGADYKSREAFIEKRSDELFGGEEWISLRHLSNIELGNNWISIEKLIALSAALEQDPVDLFSEIIDVYNKKT